MPKKKDSNRRGRKKWAALDPSYNLKSRTDLIDFDYLDKLSDKDKDWLNTFAEEYINANFNHGKKKLHKTKLQQRDCYNKNNARNRDVLTRAKASGQSVYLDDLKNQEIKIKKFLNKEPNDSEDTRNNTDDQGDDSEKL